VLDAIVVGGGVGGITAADLLTRDGLQLALCEARPRLGGRIATGLIDGVPYERGGELVDGDDGPFHRLLGRLGVGLVPVAASHRGGLAGTPAHVGGRRFEIDDGTAEMFGALDVALEEVAARLDPERPWEAADAGALDALSLAGWLERAGGTPNQLALAEVCYAVGSSTVPTREMSFLAMAAKQARRGPPSRRLASRIDGGAQALANAALATLRDSVHLAAEVVGLAHDGRGVEARLDDGRRLQARACVLALPPVPARRLLIDPPIRAHAAALERVRMGRVLKSHLVWDEPWWPDGDRELLGYTDTACGCIYSGRIVAGRALVTCFAGAGAADGAFALRPGARRAALTAALEGLAGHPLPQPRSVAMDDWGAERETGGSYLVYRVGELTALRDALAAPDGRIVPGGAEASTMPSYLQGAAEAGERAAAAVRRLM